MQTKTILLDKRGQAPTTLLAGGLLVAVTLAVLLMAFMFITGSPLAFQAGGPAPPPGEEGTGSSQNPSLEISSFEPITGDIVESTINLFKVDAGARDPNCPIRCRAGRFTTSSGTVSISNLDAQQAYLLEVETLSGATQFYPQTIRKTTAVSGPVTVPIGVTSMNNGVSTISVFNDNDKTANTTSARQSITSNDAKNFNLILQFSASQNDNNFFGTSDLGNLIVTDVNRDLIQRVSGEDNGGQLTCMAAPTAHNAVDANRTKSFACVTNVKRAAAKVNHKIRLTFDTTAVDPTNLADQNAAFWVSIYDSCRILNTQTGLYENNWFNPVTLADICTTSTHNTALFYN